MYRSAYVASVEESSLPKVLEFKFNVDISKYENKYKAFDVKIDLDYVLYPRHSALYKEVLKSISKVILIHEENI